jgi:hypothetical protein
MHTHAPWGRAAWALASGGELRRLQSSTLAPCLVLPHLSQATRADAHPWPQVPLRRPTAGCSGSVRGRAEAETGDLPTFVAV